MKRGCGIVLNGRNDDSLILPIVEILRRVKANSPMPDSAAGSRFLLVLSVPIEGIVFGIVKD